MASGIGFKSTTLSSLDAQTAAFIVKDARLVAESIHRIINTRPGERPRNPLFGCRIKEINFEQLDFTTITLAAFYVNDAISRFEPRVIVENIIPITNDAQNLLQIAVIFRLKEVPNRLFKTLSQVISNG